MIKILGDHMEKETSLEKISGSPISTAVGTLIAALVATPSAALLPVLTSSLASGRHKNRIEDAIKEIDSRLSRIENIQTSLTDAQYKLINEMVLSIFNTPDDEKLKYIKGVIYNTPYNQTLTLHEATVISRILNQSSIGELTFLIEFYGEKLLFGRHRFDGFTNIEKDSFDGECALGLISLGLISRSPAEGDTSDIGAYHFTKLASKVHAILSN